MKPSGILLKAENYRELMNSTLEVLNKALVELLEDQDACFVYQESDGWCILFDEDHNGRLSFFEVDVLLKMNKEQAYKFLRAKSI